MKKWKDTVASWVLSDLLEEGLIISLKILAKIIEIKFFRFVKDNGIVFNNKQEELELKRLGRYVRAVVVSVDTDFVTLNLNYKQSIGLTVKVSKDSTDPF